MCVSFPNKHLFGQGSEDFMKISSNSALQSLHCLSKTGRDPTANLLNWFPFTVDNWKLNVVRGDSSIPDQNQLNVHEKPTHRLHTDSVIIFNKLPKSNKNCCLVFHSLKVQNEIKIMNFILSLWCHCCY